MIITPLHISRDRTGMQWIDLIGKDPRIGHLISQNQLFGELDPILDVQPRNITVVHLHNAVINIKDFFIERDRQLYMGYEWLDTPLGERAYEAYYKDPSKCFFVPRIISGGRFRESFITVDVYGHYVNPV